MEFVVVKSEPTSLEDLDDHSFAKEEIKVRTPRVDATSSTLCLIKTSSFYFCYVMQGPFA